MVVRAKMPRSERAKQFAPFDALKGLHEALKVKEYEHDKTIKGDLFEEQIEEISRTLIELNEGDFVEVSIFEDGYEKKLTGKASINYEKKLLFVGSCEVDFDEIRDIKILKR